MPEPRPPHPYLTRVVLLALLLGSLALLVWQELPAAWFDPEWIEATLQEWGWLAPFGFILLRVVAIVVTVVPNAPLDVAAGVLFGPFWGTVYSLLGSELGAIGCFFLARVLGREALSHLLHRDIQLGERFGRSELGIIVLIARLEPIFSFSLVSYGAGLTRMSLTVFCIATLFGMTPGTILLNYFGTRFFSVSLPLQLVFGSLLVIILLLIPLWARHHHLWGGVADPPEQTRR